MESNPQSQIKVLAVRQQTSHYSNTSLFSDEAKVKLSKLVLASQHQNEFEEEQENITASFPEELLKDQPTISDVMYCNCCQVEFADREEQLIHYKCDWHRYNLHLRLKGLKCMSEQDFEQVLGDVSSISGSDEDSESGGDVLSSEVSLPIAETPIEELLRESPKQQRSHHKIFFKNEQGELISLYRCLFSHKKNPVKSSTSLITTASEMVHQKNWAVVMVSSGHFAGAIFNGKQVVDHKTFHRYTVRAKRGSAQSSRDAQGNAPKSAGASIRRYNEAALNQEVQEHMKSWQSHLDSCSLIFVHIPVANRGMFYGGKHPTLKKDDFRIRIIPFPTRRPTFSEVKRVQQMLSSIECYGQEADVNVFFPLSPQRFYCKETDELKVRDSLRIQKSKKILNDGSSPTKEPEVTKSEQEVEEHSEESEDELYPSGPGNALQEFEIPVEKRKMRRGKTPKSKTLSTNTAPKNAEDEAETSMKNSMFTACKTGNVEHLKQILADLHIFYDGKSQAVAGMHGGNENSSEKFSNGGNGCQAVDMNEESLPSGKLGNAVVNETITSMSSEKVAIFLNSKLGDSANTLLHYASQENHHEIISVLLQEGADPAVKNKNGKVPYNLGSNEVKNTYRRFMALFPEKYDYKQAQVPSPLTPELEAMRKQKNAERRTAKKKSMQERNKAKKEEEHKLKEENELKERYLNLSDREKRALAAERRILQQHSEHDRSKPVLSRCFQCGDDITGKVPFEYSNFKFCTTKCLRDHRSKPKDS